MRCGVKMLNLDSFKTNDIGDTLLKVGKLVMPFMELANTKVPERDVSSYYYQQNARSVIDKGRSLLSKQKTALAAQGVYRSSLFLESRQGMERDLFALKHEAMVRQVNEEIQRYNLRVKRVKSILATTRKKV